jgi:ABC-type antimicrobial peptide transport system permease subunit
MGALVLIGVVLAVIAGLFLYAGLIRAVLVWVAKRHGYTSNDMPIHYHMIAFGIYFSTIILVHLFTYLTIAT